MEAENALGVVGVVWMVVALCVMARSIHRGRGLVDVLARRHPTIYENVGRPRPSYWSSTRGRRFAQFIGRREFEELDDAGLSAEFEAYRRSEARLVVSVLASALLLGLLIFAFRLTV